MNKLLQTGISKGIQLAVAVAVSQCIIAKIEKHNLAKK